jgi:Double zinc ribbon
MKCPRCQHENRSGAKFCEECATPLARTCANCGSQFGHGEVLSGVRPSRSRANSGRRSLRLTPELHPEAPRREDPHVQGRARGRAETGHDALRRSEGLDRVARRSRSRGGEEDPRPGSRADDGGRPPLRGHRESGHGRRHQGALRSTSGARGSRCAGVLRGARALGIQLQRVEAPSPETFEAAFSAMVQARAQAAIIMGRHDVCAASPAALRYRTQAETADHVGWAALCRSRKSHRLRSIPARTVSTLCGQRRSCGPNRNETGTPLSDTYRRPVIDTSGPLLVAALGFAGLPRPSYDRALCALRTWLDSWAGIGHVTIGMAR